MATTQVTPANATNKKPRLTGGAGKKDAISLLKADHAEVAVLLKKFEAADEDEQTALAAQICSALTVHATVEEEIFYPAARDALEGKDGEGLLDEAEVEHDSLKYLIDQIHDAGDDELLVARVTVLGEYVRHHVKEEETELFPKLRQTDMDMSGIGEALEERKNTLAAEGTDEDEEDEEEEEEEEEDDSDEENEKE